MSNNRSHLVPKRITDKNGVTKTVWVLPDRNNPNDTYLTASARPKSLTAKPSSLVSPEQRFREGLSAKLDKSEGLTYKQVVVEDGFLDNSTVDGIDDPPFWDENDGLLWQGEPPTEHTRVLESSEGYDNEGLLDALNADDYLGHNIAIGWTPVYVQADRDENGNPIDEDGNLIDDICGHVYYLIDNGESDAYKDASERAIKAMNLASLSTREWECLINNTDSYDVQHPVLDFIDYDSESQSMGFDERMVAVSDEILGVDEEWTPEEIHSSLQLDKYFDQDYVVGRASVREANPEVRDRKGVIDFTSNENIIGYVYFLASAE